MLREIHKVYGAQGIGIADKHLEVIINQMLRKVVIVDKGDTNLIPGSRVDADAFNEANAEVLMNGGRPAISRPSILGITKAALESKSFLSAASFQETTRVLTDAAIKGKEDTLHGLKENVITGKLIPAGSGNPNNNVFDEPSEEFSVAKKMRSVKQQYIETYDRPEDVE